MPVGQQFIGAVVEQPSDMNKQQSVGQVEAMESLVLDMVKSEPLVNRVGLFEAGGHCLTRVQGAGKGVEMMVPGTPQSSAVRLASKEVSACS